jgi:hypothetical protein
MRVIWRNAYQANLFFLEIVALQIQKELSSRIQLPLELALRHTGDAAQNQGQR